MMIFQKEIRNNDLGILKVKKVLLLNVNDKDFRLEKLTKKIGVSGINPSYLTALRNMAIFAIFHKSSQPWTA